jgi:hypothetical protein
MTNYAADHIPDWSQEGDPLKFTQLIGFVEMATTPITKLNFRRWLVELAGEMVPNEAALCPNGKDHACNRGLGEWLGIEPYGQGEDGSVPWDQQQGISSERFNRYVDPKWKEAIVAAPLAVQKAMYIDLIRHVRDDGVFHYHLPAEIAAEMQAAE